MVDVTEFMTPKPPPEDSDFVRISRQLRRLYGTADPAGGLDLKVGPTWIDPGCSLGAYDGWHVGDPHREVDLRFYLNGDFHSAVSTRPLPAPPRPKPSFRRWVRRRLRGLRARFGMAWGAFWHPDDYVY